MPMSAACSVAAVSTVGCADPAGPGGRQSGEDDWRPPHGGQDLADKAVGPLEEARKVSEEDA
jgi:hypothetical protein